MRIFAFSKRSVGCRGACFFCPAYQKVRKFAMAHHLFTSESVTEGHPDKICDQISDAILDAILAQDPNGRVACETHGHDRRRARHGRDHDRAATSTSRRSCAETVREIGYDRAKYGFDCETCAVITNIDEQSRRHRPGRRPLAREQGDRRGRRSTTARATRA